jgi:pimeloyl-ACP methyl ester carboxylesterase
MRFRRWVLAVGVSTVVITATVTGTALAAPAAPEKQSTTAAGQAVGNDTTSPIEKKRVDSVPTPKLGWYACYRTAECATVRLPLDYDQPNGATTEIAVLRVKARNQQKKIGSLFVNPGGPGGQGTAIAYAAPSFLGDDVLDRFDIVGFDPRGIGFSDNVKCFTSTKDQTQALAGLNTGFPYTKAEEAAFITSAKALGAACSRTGKSLAGAMSTAEVARDMDVLRRAVGDKKLSYLGFSYGTALGQYYANMFPDRVRAVVVDGVINPVSWVGTDDTASQILDDRLQSADGAYKALHEILVRCGKAGPAYCTFAAGGDPVQKFEVLAQRLRDKPAVIGDGSDPQTVTYADFIGGILGVLYAPTGYSAVDAMSTELYDLTSPAGSVPDAKVAEAKQALITRISDERRRVSGFDFPYDNSVEGFSGVTCTDGRHPKDPNSWPAATANADKRAPYFGRAWGWSTVQCASSSWTVRDEDAYLGPFNRRTSAPVLFVGDYWDPATNYSQAVSSTKLLPNSGLVSSDSWGHTAYGTSACVTGAVDRYLVEGVLPATGTPCVGDVQPFTKPLDSSPPAGATRPQPNMGALSTGAAPAGSGKQLPPVAVRVPPSVLLGTR